MGIKDKYLNSIRILNYLMILSVAFTLPFPNKVSRIFWFLWLVTWVLEGRFLSKTNFIAFNRKQLPVLLLSLFYVFEMFSLFWANNVDSGLTLLGKQFSLLAVVPIVFYGVNNYYKVKNILLSLILGSLVSVLVYYMVILYVYNYEFTTLGEDIATWKGLDYKMIELWSSNLKHRLFYSTVLAFSILATFLVKKQLEFKYGKILTNLFVWISNFIFFISIVLTGSRVMVLSLLIMLVVYIYLSIKKKYRIILVPFILIFCLGSILAAFKFHPRMSQFKTSDFKVILDGKIENAQIEPRLLIWHAVVDSYDSCWISGIGVGNSREFLVQKYIEKDYPDSIINNRYSTHNQFLNAFMELGVVGLIFLLLYWFFYYRFYDGEIRKIALFFSIFMFFNFMTDDILINAAGVITLTFVSLLLSWYEDNKQKTV